MTKTNTIVEIDKKHILEYCIIFLNIVSNTIINRILNSISKKVKRVYI